MKIKRVTAMYLSCTGTTKKVVEYVAQNAADKLGAEYAVFDFSLPQAREEACTYGESDLVICGTPVYAGRVPNLFLPYLKEKVRGSGALAVPIVLFGNRNFDDALAELRDILTVGGFRALAAGAFVGEHAFSAVLGAGRPDKEDFAKADELVSLIEGRVRALEATDPNQSTVAQTQVMTAHNQSAAEVEIPVPVPGASPQTVYYTPRDRHGNAIDIRKVKPKTNGNCIAASGCRICAENCPMGAIDFDDPSKITGICMKCGACVKRCPQGAKYYDDEGYLYHKTELEEMYARRAESTVY